MTCLHKRIGQSMVELSFVVLAVIAGIILGGPYLLDSINSQFKLWDTAVADSNNDRLVEANPDDLFVNGTTCVQTSKAPGSCGTRECGSDPTLRYYTYQYEPVGCQTKFTCDPDETCCTIPTLTAICWRVGDPNNATRTWARTDQIPADLISQGFRSCFPGGTACKNGDELYRFSCGNLPDMYIAKENDARCMPICDTSTLPRNATACPGQGDGKLMAADKDFPDLLLSTDVCSTFGGACQAKCEPNTIPYHRQCAKSCLNINPNRPIAVAGCPADYCLQGQCNAGHCTTYFVEQ